MGDTTNVLVGVAKLEIKYPIDMGEYEDAGYTEDGVTIEYSQETTDHFVEEEMYPIKNTVNRESMVVIVNLAEMSLDNLYKAISGSSLDGNVLTISGAGARKEMSIKVTGISPEGTDRVWEFPLCVSESSVSVKHRRNEKSLIPCRFKVLKGTDDVCKITDEEVS